MASVDLRKCSEVGEPAAIEGRAPLERRRRSELILASMQLWFALDNRTAGCGLVAASSALRQWSAAEPLSIVAAYEAGTPAPADFWPSKLVLLQKPFEFRQCPVNVSDFDNCKGVFDSRAAYIRLMIPFFTEGEIVIYSDSDVVFLSDPGEIAAEFLTRRAQNEVIGLVSSGRCGDQPVSEQKLLEKYDKAPGSAYFHSGLAVFDTPSYRTAGLGSYTVSIARTDGGKLTYHDQTLWNCALREDQITKLDPKWVQLAWPGLTENVVNYKEGILHFAGSPKPWDLFGEFFHPYHSRYHTAALAAGCRCPSLAKYFDRNSWQRAARIKNQYEPWLRDALKRGMIPRKKHGT